MPSGRQIAYQRLCSEAYANLVCIPKPTLEVFEIQFRKQRRKNVLKAARIRYEATKRGMALSKIRKNRYYLIHKKRLVIPKRPKPKLIRKKTTKGSLTQKSTKKCPKMEHDNQHKTDSKSRNVLSTKQTINHNKGNVHRLLCGAYLSPLLPSIAEIKPVLHAKKIQKKSQKKRTIKKKETVTQKIPPSKEQIQDKPMNRRMPFTKRLHHSMPCLGR